MVEKYFIPCLNIYYIGKRLQCMNDLSRTSLNHSLSLSSYFLYFLIIIYISVFIKSTRKGGRPIACTNN